MKILYISPENTVGLLTTWKKIHEMNGNTCDFVTMYQSKQGFDDGICLDLPLITTNYSYIYMRNLYYKMTRGKKGDQEIISSIPPFNKTNAFEKIYYRLRDLIWRFKVEKAITDYKLLDYDVYHFEWGMDIYRNCDFLKRVKNRKKIIIANYHGQDIRTRGILNDMDCLADLNITSEADLVELYPKLKLFFLPYDVQTSKPNFQVNQKIKIIHAPTNRYYKGSKKIIEVGHKLMDNYNIDFELIENMEHDALIKKKMNCDILIDQVGDRGGWGYGMSSVESMAMGTCCATQINDKLNNMIPDHPFLNITEDNMYIKLSEIIENRSELEKRKKQSYDWVYQNHDMNNVIKNIYSLYNSVKYD